MPYKVSAKTRFSLLTLIISVFGTCSAQTRPSPVGYWKTIDDVTHHVKSIVQITENKHHQLQGKVIKLFPSPGHECVLCAACKGKKHNKPILGMVIMDKLKRRTANPLVWRKGTILDPANGKVYKMDAWLTSDNQRLMVRGYLGMPMFGRTQIWQRVSLNHY